MTTPINATRPFVDGKGALTPFGRSVLDTMRTATGGAVPIIPGNIAFKTADETITGAWNFDQRPKAGGINLANIHEIPQLFGARSDVTAATIPATWDFIVTAGYAAVGDGGGAVYKRVASEPSHPGKVQSSDGAWWELQPDDGRLNVKQLGARGDNATDDTTAIQDAIRVAVANANGTARVDGHFRIIFPPGTYRVTSGVFSVTSSAPYYGFVFEGAGRDSTIIELQDDGATTRWFYDNGATATADRLTFKHMLFRGTDQTRSNGFKLTDSTGKEKRFTWIDCSFHRIGNALETDGSTNADECTFIACELGVTSTLAVTTAVKTSNGQSMLHHFIGCRGYFTGHVWHITADGGGALAWFGGSIMTSPSADAYWLYGDGDPVTSHQTGNFLFEGVRAELRGANAKLVHWLPTTATSAQRQVRVDFNSCNLATASQGSGILRPDAVLIGSGKVVTFRGCMFPAARTGTIDNYGLTVTSDNGWSTTSNPGVIILDNCTVHDTISADCTITNRYGRIIGRNLAAGGTRADDDRQALDFDLGWDNAPGSSPGIQPSVFPMLRWLWPLGSGSNEITVTLPPGAMLRRVTMFKPAQGTDSASTQYRFGSDGKTTVYAETPAARADAEHKIDQPVNIAAFSTATKLRLWATGGTTNQEGGYVVVEYI